MLDFLNGLPTAAWTLIGAALGIVGTILVERTKRKSDAHKDDRIHEYEVADRLEQNQRDAYVDVISATLDYMNNTNAERVTLRDWQYTPDAVGNQAILTLNTKAMVVASAGFKASIISDSQTRTYLGDLRHATTSEVTEIVRAYRDEVPKEDSPAPPSVGESFRVFNDHVHAKFAPRTGATS